MAANLNYSNGCVNFAYREDHGSIWHQSGQIIKLDSINKLLNMVG